MATPIVPPRPSRTIAASHAAQDAMPEIPPRPMRKIDPSPSRLNSSPFNELPNPLGKIPSRQSNLADGNELSRSKSVNIPSIGQEGSEYASYDQLPAEAHGVKIAAGDGIAAPEQTRNVSANMPLHAPTASPAQSLAKSRIETVTRTDSTQAAALGIGKAKPDDDVHNTPADSITEPPQAASSKGGDLKRVPSADPALLRQKPSFNRSTPTLPQGSSKPSSMYEDEQERGIPEIGTQIPLYPNAGDVQAPPQAPTQAPFARGVGFFNDGSMRAHQRRKSGQRQFDEGYGLHGHSQEPHDQFEREWYEKNRDRATREAFHVYDGRPRPKSALSTAELNRIVSYDPVTETNPNMIGMPDEYVAFAATDVYSSRGASAATSPVPLAARAKRPSSGSQPVVESPLRKMSFPSNQAGGARADEALESEDDAVHVDAPERRRSRITGGGEEDGAIDLGPHGGNTEEEGGWFEEGGEGTPILASDEVLKRHESAAMLPAVNPELEYDSDQYHDSSRRSSLRVPSRPSSRPNSMHGEYHGGNLYRFMSHEDHQHSGMHTPLEEIEEYEPLIPEGEEGSPKPKQKIVKRRPGLEHHHFPSQDIWEDTPSSLYFLTTVQTPEPPRAETAAAEAMKEPSLFETPEQEQQRSAQTSNEMFSDNKLFSKPHLKDASDHRPGMPRFPSKDIWEDAPASLYYLTTTVSGPQTDEAKSPPDDSPMTTGFTPIRRPSVPARPPKRSKLAEEITPEEKSPDATREISNEQPPSPEKSKAPAIPDRPKPSVPARPARPSRTEQKDESGAELTKSTSTESSETVTSPPVVKAKPAVPARPGGEKIAALKAGFMTDLNNRLKLGPQVSPPKTRELEPEATEETKAPLADARKSRAKGPARRKPASSPSAVDPGEEKAAGLSMSTMSTMWHIDEKDELQVPSFDDDVAADPEAGLNKAMEENEAANTAEPTLTQPLTKNGEGGAIPAAAQEGYVQDEVHIPEEPAPTIQEGNVQDEVHIPEESAPVLQKGYVQDEVHIPEEPAPAVQERYLQDEVHIPEEPAPVLQKGYVQDEVHIPAEPAKAETADVAHQAKEVQDASAAEALQGEAPVGTE